MKTRQKPDKRIHIRKKVAGGTTGALLGAVVGGPVGALVGGVIGTIVGGAAESGQLNELTRTDEPAKQTGNQVSKAVRTRPGKSRQSIGRVKHVSKRADHSFSGRRRKTAPGRSGRGATKKR